ncbi:MAG: hypothetical protein J6D08_13470 [Lachnospiraceae bacterium]|nr:hypothetical protein [Lachnospiraceae bacterium]
MRRTSILLAAVTGSILIAGCKENLSPQQPDSGISGMVSDIGEQTAEELKDAFIKEVDEFFQSGDLSETLGISSEKQDQVEASIRQYLDEYSMDEEKLGEAKESLEKLLENAQGLSTEELEDKIAEIFEK